MPPLNEIINQHRGIGAESALAFADAFKMEPEFLAQSAARLGFMACNEKT